VKPDGTASSIIADENDRFPKGNYVTGLDGQSGQGIKKISSSEDSVREKWPDDLTFWGICSYIIRWAGSTLGETLMAFTVGLSVSLFMMKSESRRPESSETNGQWFCILAGQDVRPLMLSP
jgi:hypothetical protein